MNERPCRRHAFDAGRCVLCGAAYDQRIEHRGMTVGGVVRACIQEVHFCW